MKEATGELNMTVVTVVAIAAVGAFFYAFIWPGIQRSLAQSTCSNMCPMTDSTGTTYDKTDITVNLKTKTCTCPGGGTEIKYDEDEV